MDEHTLAIITADLTTSSTFHIRFIYHHTLGYGSDGQVNAFSHWPTSSIIAVKTPRADRFWTSDTIVQEARVLSSIGLHGRHGNIAGMIAYQPDFGDTFCPAIFSECANYGNLLDYRAKWQDVQKRMGEPYGIREETVWKLFKDLVLALDFLYNKCGFIHRDVKSENVLVFREPGWSGVGMPMLPVFKLCDFSRAVKWPAADGKVNGWAGTVDYAPPLSERLNNQPALPAGDMWALGATIQEFALGVSPIQSPEALISLLDEAGEAHPQLHGEESLWIAQEWRDKFSAAYRPLNRSASDLESCFQLSRPMSRSYVPFSDQLQYWYTKLLNVDPRLRVTAEALVQELVPSIDGYIVAKISETIKTDSVIMPQSQAGFQAAAQHDARYQAEAATAVQGSEGRRPNQGHSYEGNDYPQRSE